MLCVAAHLPCCRTPSFFYSPGDLTDNRIVFVGKDGWKELEEELWIKDCAVLWQRGSQARKLDLASVCSLCHKEHDEYESCPICGALFESGKFLSCFRVYVILTYAHL